ncbi:unnamed protein product [Amoebophrya sp. A120]|nr:unnamed protein product [Amoebophrya sp. A120]|eukprot:GSA120T00002284001.1
MSIAKRKSTSRSRSTSKRAVVAKTDPPATIAGTSTSSPTMLGWLLMVVEAVLHTAGYVWMIILAKLLMSSSMPFPLFLIFTDQIMSLCTILTMRKLTLNKNDGRTTTDSKPKEVNALGLTAFGFLREVAPMSLMTIGTGTCGMGSNLFLFPSVTEGVSMALPVFQVPLSILFVQGRENFDFWKSLPMLLSLVPLCFGGVLSSAGEVNFHALGMFFALAALAFRALRMLFTSVVVKRRHGQCQKRVVLDLALSIMPFNMVAVLMLSAWLEGAKPWQIVYESTAAFLKNPQFNAASVVDPDSSKDFRIFGGSVVIPVLLLILCKGACTATWYVTECLLIEKRGSVFCSVIANLNRVCCIATGLVMFQNPVSPVQMIGFVLTIGGLFAYSRATAGAAESASPEAETKNKNQ